MLETLLIVLIVVVLVAAIVTFLPIDRRAKSVIWVLVLVVFLIWLLRGV